MSQRDEAGGHAVPLAQRRLISRTVVATVAQQEDYMKRVRGNGGSRTSLRPGGS